MAFFPPKIRSSNYAHLNAISFAILEIFRIIFEIKRNVLNSMIYVTTISFEHLILENDCHAKGLILVMIIMQNNVLTRKLHGLGEGLNNGK